MEATGKIFKLLDIESTAQLRKSFQELLNIPAMFVMREFWPQMFGLNVMTARCLPARCCVCAGTSYDPVSTLCVLCLSATVSQVGVLSKVMDVLI